MVGPALSALAAAGLFGLSVPAAKALLEGRGLAPTGLAGLLYLSAGLALAAVQLVRRRPLLALPGPAWRRVLAVAFVGGVAAPLALTHGLTRAEGQVAAVLLGLEGAFTALLAALLFREHVGARAGLAVSLAAGAGLVLAEPWAAQASRPDAVGILLVAGATLGWALDNNLSRALGDRDPVQVAALKGLVAGPVSLAFAVAARGPLPLEMATLGGAALVGVLSYGLSLVLLLRALAGLGTARAMTLFSTGPLFGAVGSWLALGERPGPWLAAALALLAGSLWLLARERHEHEHAHGESTHEHAHEHDEHHRHDHDATDATGGGRHRHSHSHRGPVHSHGHAPDLHHRHGHEPTPPPGGRDRPGRSP